MLVKPQEVEVRWNRSTKKYYENLGYTFNDYGDYFLVKLEDLPKGSDSKVIVKCDFCGAEILKSYNDYNKTHNGKDACGHCNQKKARWIDLQKRATKQMNKYFKKCEELNLTPLSNISDYINSSSKIRFSCDIHGEQEVSYTAFMVSQYGCAVCAKKAIARKNTKSIDDVKRIVESKNNNILLNPEDYLYKETSNLKVKCGSCGNVFTTSLASIDGGSGCCLKCKYVKTSKALKLSMDEVENRINSTNGNILLNKEDYESYSEKNLNIRCLCGKTFTTSLLLYEQDGINRCSSCLPKMTKDEQKVADVLSKFGIKFKNEHWFPNCRDKRPLPFDFYLYELNSIIEFDGLHHYEPIYGEENFQKTIYHDKIKNKYCEDNGIKLIRIPYWEKDDIQTIIIQGLGLDLEKTA